LFQAYDIGQGLSNTVSKINLLSLHVYRLQNMRSVSTPVRSLFNKRDSRLR